MYQSFKNWIMGWVDFMAENPFEPFEDLRQHEMAMQNNKKEITCRKAPKVEDKSDPVIVCLSNSCHYDDLYYRMTRDSYNELRSIEGRGLDIETYHRQETSDQVYDILSQSERIWNIKTILRNYLT